MMVTHEMGFVGYIYLRNGIRGLHLFMEWDSWVIFIYEMGFVG